MPCSNLLVEEVEVCIGSSTPEGQPPPVQVIVSLKITTEAAECVAVVLSSENSVLNLGVVCPSLSSLLLSACLTLPVAGVRSPVYNVCLICVGAVCHSVCFVPSKGLCSVFIASCGKGMKDSSEKSLIGFPKGFSH